MSTRNKIIGVVILTTLSFACGRYFTPEKVKIETKTVEVERKTTDEKEKVHQVTKVTKTVAPDGTTRVDTTITRDAGEETKTSEQDEKVVDRTKEVTRTAGTLSLSVLGGIRISNLSTPVYGGAISKQVIGPISVGVWGLSNATAGLSVGLIF